ncbi:MAG: lipid-A-disaccharide synthase N-terminal domain-containing protein [Akkermansiaceae bacterium]|nr:lipid-A-disaccharide synthase N-terminal domain-containing protein [Akkermansiaceae bacterium]
MLKSRRRLVAAIALVVLLPTAVWIALYLAGAAPAPGQPLKPPFNLSDRLSTLIVEETEAGGVGVVFERGEGGEPVRLGAEEFLREVKSRQPKQRFFRLIDVTSWTGVLWFFFGLAAQATFTARMLVQWWAAEKAKSAVVPPMFWWLSLAGASMLMIYFIWRKEVVGFLGQSTGWFIYIRNLWFIYGHADRDRD